LIADEPLGGPRAARLSKRRRQTAQSVAAAAAGGLDGPAPVEPLPAAILNNE
jgi:hypothetical protein